MASADNWPSASPPRGRVSPLWIAKATDSTGSPTNSRAKPWLAPSPMSRIYRPCAQAVRQLETQLGPTDLLVASAGIGIETPAETFRAEDFTAQIQVNLIGVVNTLDAVLPGMCQRRSGQIAALSSMASYRGLPHMGGYCASKSRRQQPARRPARRTTSARYRGDDPLPCLDSHTLDNTPGTAR